MTTQYDAIDLEILNSKLVSIIEEASLTLLRTCYSSIVRDSRDFTCTLLDNTGHLLAQAPSSLPAFTATMPRTVRACLQKFPVSTLNEGDVLITNDPWIAIGHLNDVCIVTPIWYQGNVVAFAANAANVADIGGRIMGAQGASIYEEGIQIPILKLYDRGTLKTDILDIIRQNVRMSDQVLGDIRAQIASNQTCARRLVEFIDESGIIDFTSLSTAIQGRSEEAMRRAILEIPDGEYSHVSYTHGYDEEIRIQLKLIVKGDQIVVDYEGTSPEVNRGINSVLNYTFAYTAYTIKCVIAPHIPNNEGCFRPITVVAPERTIVNPVYPAPVAARSQTGKFLPIPVMRALAQAMPDKVIADSGSAPLWCPSFSVRDPETRNTVTHTSMLTGGFGARASADGISAIDFPSVIVNVPAELHEHRFPVLIRRWNLIPDSGGAGRHRGGMGFDFEMQNISGEPITASLRCERTEHPAEGVAGGSPGSLG
ncbi:MAG: hydantoinase B/oxoprolinase family protein, partial [Gemmatimonadales bacterium]|nr:hydantoinase B/oxoprolinase family protein [Gemmatimonadales bacterium]